MGRPPLKLGRPDVAAVIDERYAAETVVWRKRRLLAVKLAVQREHSGAEIAERCGVTRTQFYTWINRVREGGFDARLQRWKRRSKDCGLRGVKERVMKELRGKV